MTNCSVTLSYPFLALSEQAVAHFAIDPGTAIVQFPPPCRASPDRTIAGKLIKRPRQPESCSPQVILLVAGPQETAMTKHLPKCRPTAPGYLSAMIAALAGSVGVAPAMAAQEPHQAQIAMELNLAESLEEGCRLTFVTRDSAGELADLAYEFAFFGTDGRLARLGVLRFGQHLAGRPKVSRFTLEGLACEAIGSAFVNGEAACEGAAAGSCLRHLKTENRTGIEF